MQQLSKLVNKLSENSKQALTFLRPWYENGARTHMGEPGTALVNEINVIFRGGVFGLVNTYGGGVSGLARPRGRPFPSPEPAG